MYTQSQQYAMLQQGPCVQSLTGGHDFTGYVLTFKENPAR
jgi:hypothetical protein